jgi:hypothetical protein
MDWSTGFRTLGVMKVFGVEGGHLKPVGVGEQLLKGLEFLHNPGDSCKGEYLESFNWTLGVTQLAGVEGGHW